MASYGNLFDKLIEAKSQPSRAYRDLQSALGAIEQTGEGYLKGTDIREKFRKRKLQQQTLAEALGGEVPERLQPFSQVTAEQVSPFAPLLKNGFGDDFGDTEMSDLKKDLLRARAENLRKSKPANPLDDQLKKARIKAINTSPTGQATKETAMSRVSSNLKDIRSYYNELDQMKGIASTDRGNIDNLEARAKSSGVGQAVGQAFGTKEQSVRNKIKMMQPLLIQDIRKASEMGAKGLDSEKELAFYLRAATDPSIDIQANLQALDVLDRAYGLGMNTPGETGGQQELYATATNAQGTKIETTDGGKTWRPVKRGN